MLSAFVPGLSPGVAGTGRIPRLLAAVECGLKAVALRRIPWPDRPGQAAAKEASADNPEACLLTCFLKVKVSNLQKI